MQTQPPPRAVLTAIREKKTMTEDKYAPRREHKFTFGLWTVGNRGRDPFGDAVRPSLPPNDAARMLGEVGAWGVNFHDNDLMPIDATPPSATASCGEFRGACEDAGLVVPMATINLFFDPVFKDGAFTANDARVRAYAMQKTMRAMDLGASSARRSTSSGAGARASKRTPAAAPTRRSSGCARRSTTSANTASSRGTATASRSRPSRTSRAADIYMPTTGAYLGLIPTLDHPEMVGVNPEVAHEHMAGLTCRTRSRRRGRRANSSTSTSTIRYPAATTRTCASARPTRRRVLAREVAGGRRLRRPARTSTRTPTGPRTTRA